VSLVRRLLSRGKLRKLRRDLGREPSPVSYATLANQYAWAGTLREARRIAEEGLEAFPGNPELQRLTLRLRKLEREDLLSELRAELAEAPRPAIWMEMCDVLLESGQVARAEEVALDWHEQTEDPEALLALARARVERYRADLGRDAGSRAFTALDEAVQALAGDTRPLWLRASLLSSIGAWEDARQTVQRLLFNDTATTETEARFRSLEANAKNSPSLEQALREVERTGTMKGGVAPEPTQSVEGVRPLLKQLAECENVRGVVYTRGGTALVQGLRGATAERTARSVRTVVQSARATARRLGLGQVSEVRIEGDFGQLVVASGERDAGALWCAGPPREAELSGLQNLAGQAADNREVPQ